MATNPGTHYNWRDSNYNVTITSLPIIVVFAIGAAFVLIGFLLGSGTAITDRGTFWLIGGICMLAAAPLMMLRLEVNADGVRVSSALLGITLKRVPAQMIQGVQFGSVSPSEWGGWGLRLRQRSLGFILAGSDGLIVYCRDLTKLAVTVPAKKLPSSLRA